MHRVLRSLLRTPAFTLVAILTLSLGLASVTTMFALVHGVLLAPLRFGDPESLVSIALESGKRRIPQPPALRTLYRENARSLDEIGFFRHGTANLGLDGEATESAKVAWVTASLLPMLQVAPLLGRTFTAEEEHTRGSSAVILSEPEWRARFAADPEVIGRTLRINSVPRVIVGVMPVGFAFPTADTRYWLPARTSTDPVVGEFSYAGVARLADGATPDQARQELASLLPRLAEAFPRVETGASTATWLAEMDLSPVVTPLRTALTADIAATLWSLAASAGLVLLIAWANVANLVLIRSAAREPELAAREALGAGRWQLASAFLGESLALAAISGAIALLLSGAAIRAFVAFGPADVPRLGELGISGATIAFLGLVCLASALACALAPALRGRRSSLADCLRDGARGASTGHARQRAQAAAAVLQIALALLVSIASASLLATALRLSRVDPGFTADGVSTLTTLLPYASYSEQGAVDFHARLTERIRQIPGIDASGLTMRLPLRGGIRLDESFRPAGSGQTELLPVNIVDEGYFDAMRIPLIAGRGFRRTGEPGARELVLSRRAAASLFGDAGGTAAVGEQLMLGSSTISYTIVGVVGDVHYDDLARAPAATVYRPHAVPIDPALEPPVRRGMTLVLRSREPASAFLAQIRALVRELDPGVPVLTVQSMPEVVRDSMARLSLTLVLMSAAAAVSLLLGAVGLYGVMAYLVALRTREFGVRLALGAEPARIAAWVTRRGLMLAGSGVGIGLVAFGALAPWLPSEILGVDDLSPAPVAAAVLALLASTTLASWLPALRAMRVDPCEALRAT